MRKLFLILPVLFWIVFQLQAATAPREITGEHILNGTTNVHVGNTNGTMATYLNGTLASNISVPFSLLAGTISTAQIGTPTIPFTQLSGTLSIAQLGSLGGGGGGGTGTVVGPAIADDNAIVLFNGTTGTLLKNSNLLLTNGTLTVGGAAVPVLTNGTLKTSVLGSIPASLISAGTLSGAFSVTGDLLVSPDLLLQGNGVIEAQNGQSIDIRTQDRTGDTLPASLYSGSSSTGNSGNVWLLSGNATSGTTGDINILTGSTSGTRGKIKFVDGSEGASGKAWVSTDTLGSGRWGSLAATQISGTLATAQIGTYLGNISASQVTSGTLATSQIGTYLGNISASQVTTGTLNTAQIGNISASQVASGTLATAQIGTYLGNIAASQVTSGTLATSQIGTYLGNIAASQVTSGTLNTAQLGTFDASKIASGTLATARIGTYLGNISASQIASGTLATAQIGAYTGDVTAVAGAANASFPIFTGTSGKILFGSTLFLQGGQDLYLQSGNMIFDSGFGIDGAAVTTGTLNTARLGTFDASKIASGTISTARLGTIPIFSLGTTGGVTGQVPKITSGTVGWGAGGGSGTKNYLGSINGVDNGGDFEAGTRGSWTLGTVAISAGLPTGTIAVSNGTIGNLQIGVTASGPNSGAYSLYFLSSTASVVGNALVSPVYTIDSSDQAKTQAFSFTYQNTFGPANVDFSGTSTNSFAVAVYDVTNSTWLQIANPYCMIQSSGVGICNGGFLTSATSTQYRFLLYSKNATSGGFTFLFDDFAVGPIVPPGIIPKAQTRQVITATGAGTYTTPVGVSYIVVKMWGGGGGGGPSGTAGGGTPGTGGAGTFGVAIANGGLSGVSGPNGGIGGNGGSNSNCDFTTVGNAGQTGTFSPTTGTQPGGNGGGTALGGSGQGGSAAGAAYVGTAGQANSGAGGGGAASNNSSASTGGGGGAGGFCQKTIANPTSSYSINVPSGGAGGSAGTNGFAGGNGGSGIIIVDEFYFGSNVQITSGGGPVSANYVGQPTGTINTSFNVATIPTRISDTHGAYSAGTYTVPVTDFYNIEGKLSISFSSTAAGNYAGTAIFIDGVETYTHYETIGNTLQTFMIPQVTAFAVPLRAGQLVTIRSITTVTGPTYINNAAQSSFSITRANGSQIAINPYDQKNIVTQTATYTALSTDSVILGSGTMTVNLPAAATVKGKEYVIQSTSSTGRITIDPNSSETACGKTTIMVAGDSDGITIFSDGSNWKGKTTKDCYREEFYSTTSTCTAGTCSASTSSPGVSSATFVSAGTYTLTWVSSSIWSVAPACGCNLQDSNSDACSVSASSTSAATIKSGYPSDIAGTKTTRNNNFQVRCQGPR